MNSEIGGVLKIGLLRFFYFTIVYNNRKIIQKSL